MKLLIAAATLSVMAMSAQAATKQMYCGTERMDKAFSSGYSKCTNVPANRRDSLGKKVKGGTPVAVVKNNNNDLFLVFTISGGNLKACQVANNVGKVAVSQYANDTATAYYSALSKIEVKGEKRQTVWELQTPEGEISKGACPKAAKYDMRDAWNSKANPQDRVGPELEEFKMLSQEDGIIGAAIFKGGAILKWGPTKFFRFGKNGPKAYGELR